MQSYALCHYSGSVQHHGYAMQRMCLDHDSTSVRTPVSGECFCHLFRAASDPGIYINTKPLSCPHPNAESRSSRGP